MAALAAATREVLRTTGMDGGAVAAIALDTTGSSVIPVGEGLEPLDEYYLWCDHRAYAEAEEITAKAHATGVWRHRVVRRGVLARVGICEAAALAASQPREARKICDGAGALRHGGGDAERRDESEHRLKRSVCAMGHKWMWNPKWGGLPPEEFLVAVDPLFKGVRAKMGGEYRDERSRGGAAFAGVGGKAGTARGNSDSGGSVRCALGCDRDRISAKATW